jgi:hypothetical protein
MIPGKAAGEFDVAGYHAQRPSGADFHHENGRRDGLWKGRPGGVGSCRGTGERVSYRQFLLWHHVGYFPQEVELAMPNEFVTAVIKPLNKTPPAEGAERWN